MGRFFKRVLNAAEAAGEAFDPSPFRVRGENVACPVCGRGEFLRSHGGELPKPLFGSVRVPWLKLDPGITTLICTHCVHVLHFGRTPERVDVAQEEMDDGRDIP
jgi:hypothetical protein